MHVGEASDDRDEHVFTGFCGFPGALWLGDHCDLDVAPPDRPAVAVGDVSVSEPPKAVDLRA